MLFLIFGFLFIGGAAILDSIFRIRMSRIGRKSALLEGGAFNYSNYHKVRANHGWSAWPVYLMWTLMICGLALAIAGFFVQFGTHPRNRIGQNLDRHTVVEAAL